jgi:hypothetical protein
MIAFDRARFPALVIVLMVLVSCAGKPVKNGRDERSAGYISWEFTTLTKGRTVYTDAVMVINIDPKQRHQLGEFPGPVARFLKHEDKNKEKSGGTISGFITHHEDEWHEVLVRFDEQKSTLVVVSRVLDKDEEPGPFRTIKTIMIPRHQWPDAGF